MDGVDLEGKFRRSRLDNGFEKFHSLLMNVCQMLTLKTKTKEITILLLDKYLIHAEEPLLQDEIE